MNMLDVMKAKGKGLYCLTGGAGSGKSTLASELKHHGISVYSIDWRFIGDSKYRRDLLEKKKSFSWSSYMDACNQFNWWNWDDVICDCQLLLDGNWIVIKDAYDRDLSSLKEVTIPPNDYILMEGAIPGPVQLLEKYKVIFKMIVPPEVRLLRLLGKDSDRRDLPEILSRFIITEYSEQLAYSKLYDWFDDKVLNVDEDGKVLNRL